ncbi:MAG: ATP-binding protein [Clostridiales bacterium]|nr:ATP-binding protein [Clostridiales bacterium]
MPNKSSLYRTILRDYERTRDLAAAELKKKQEKIYHRIPEIQQIDEKISQTGLSIARAVLAQPKKAAELTTKLQNDIALAKKQKADLLEQAGLPKDYLSIKYQCTNCKDTGYIGSTLCPCFTQKLVEAAYSFSNLKEILADENFDSFVFDYYSPYPDEKTGISPRDNIKEIYTVCVNFVNKFDVSFQNLMMYGSTGLGKTFLCNCIAKELLDQGKTVLYTTAAQLFKMIEELRFRHNEDQEPDSYLDDILTVDLLIIDDLGTEFSTVLSSSELFSILNTRLLEKKPVIISTNLAYQDLIHQYSDRIISRITGNYTALRFFGKDIRLIKKFDRKE